MATTAAKKKPGQADAPALYLVLSPLDHDQVRYDIGEEVELTEAEAAPLLGHTVKAKPKAAPG